MSKSKPSLPRGTRDFGPEISAKRSFIIEKIRANFIKYGFSQLETPAMEQLSTLTGKYGEEGDQLLYKVLNSGDFLSKSSTEDFEAGSKQLAAKISDKGLRYDLTVPFARYVVMNQHEITFPFKRFQIQPVWRADRPQKGRYREFYQCDADIVGSKGIWNEVELALLLKDALSDLGLQPKDCVIKVNHRELLFLMARHVGLKGHEAPFCTELDKLDKIGQEKVVANIVALGADEPRLEEIFRWIEASDSRLLHELQEQYPDNPGIKEILEFLEILGTLKNKKIPVVLDLSLARGLSYYTGMIYEVKPLSVEMGSICGGGRYDNLTGIFGLDGVSGIGVSFGLDRIFDVMEQLDLFPKAVSQRLDVLLIHFSQENLEHAYQLIVKLRDQDIKADLYPHVDKIKKQFNYADKIKTPYTLIIGDEEMASGKYGFKNMDTGEQNQVQLDEIIKHFKG